MNLFGITRRIKKKKQQQQNPTAVMVSKCSSVLTRVHPGEISNFVDE
jgi:hypothetical protein